MAYWLDIETLGLDVDALGCDDGQGGGNRDTGGEGGDGSWRQVHKAGRIGKDGSTAHDLQKMADAWHYVAQAERVQLLPRSHPDNCKKRKQLGSIAAQGSQAQCHMQGLSRMRLEHTERQSARKSAVYTGHHTGLHETAIVCMRCCRQ